jgi:hypothetical protein
MRRHSAGTRRDLHDIRRTAPATPTRVGPATGPHVLPHHHQPVRIPIGQGLEKYARDDAEDRRIGANPSSSATSAAARVAGVRRHDRQEYAASRMIPCTGATLSESCEDRVNTYSAGFSGIFRAERLRPERGAKSPRESERGVGPREH